MTYTFDFTEQDYLDAKSLEKANANALGSAGLIKLVGFLAVGVLIYLNVTTFRMSFRINDTLAYALGGAVVIILLIILTCLAGGIYGLAAKVGMTVTFGTFLNVFYVLEIAVSLFALLYWYQPDFLIRNGIRQNLSAGFYPTGYLGERKVEWDEFGIAFRYGVIGLSVGWDTLTAVYDDSEYIYFYQGRSLLLFLPQRELNEEKQFLQFYLRDHLQQI